MGVCTDEVVVKLRVDAGDFLTENAIDAIRAIVRDEVCKQLGINSRKVIPYNRTA